MYAYCVQHLGMSEGRAYRRVAAARLVRRYPFLLERLERGEVNVSTLAQISTYLTDENVHDVVEATRGKNRIRVEMYLATRFGRHAITPQRHGEMLFIDEDFYSLLQWARERFSNAIPDGDITKVTKRVYAELKARIEKEDREILEGPVPVPKKRTKKVPQKIKRYVWARDVGRCTYVDPMTGQRCRAKVHLDIDHILGRADGGTDDVENLRLACKAHNFWFAQLRYGAAYIDKRVRLRQRRSPPAGPDSDEPPST